MNAQTDTPTTAGLLEIIRIARAELEDLLEELDEAQMVAAPIQDGWTIKDILAHIAAWERLAADRLQSARHGSAPNYPLIRGDHEVDAFNARLYAEHKDQALSAVQAEFQAAHQDLLAEISRLTDSQLAEKLPFDWAGKLSYQVLISANTHWHYNEHSTHIENWLDNR